MPIVVNKYDLKGRDFPKNALFVARPTIWGNPFQIGTHGTREEVIRRYEAWLLKNPTLMARLPELRGMNLVCWCAPEPCHADVLLRYANSTPTRKGPHSDKTLKLRPPPVPPDEDGFKVKLEGTAWVAYYIVGGAVGDMFTLGSIRWASVKKSPERRETFLTLMRSLAHDIHTARMSGVEPGEARKKARLG